MGTYGTATGIVMLVESGAGKLLGLNAGNVQAYFDSDGTIKWGGGTNWLNSTGLNMQHTTGATVGVFYKNSNPFLHDYADATADGYNLFFGELAGNFTCSPAGGSSMLASYNVALGYAALHDLTTGAGNVAIGKEALNEDTVGGYNVAIGPNSLKNNKSGSRNVAVGFNAMYNHDTYWHNVAIGDSAAYANTSGYSFVAVGQDSLRYNTSGWRNVAIGYEALYSNTEGDNNTALGADALWKNTTGSKNTALGQYAGSKQADESNLTTPENSVYIGYDAHGYNDDDSNSIVIGYEAIGLGANTTVIGNSSTTTAKIWGTLTLPSTIYIGDTANANMTLGLTINQGAADDEILTLKSSDIAHGLTTVTETDTYAYAKKFSATLGGLQLVGLSDGDGAGLELRGIIGAADPTDTVPALILNGYKSNGTTGVAAIGAAETLLQIQNNGSAKVTVLGDGTIKADVLASSASALVWARTIKPSGANVASVFLGLGAGNATLSDGGGGGHLASGNVALGSGPSNVGPGAALTTGYANTLLGAGVAPLLTTGYNNVAAGNGAMAAAVDARTSTAVGVSALGASVSGYNNTAVGVNALLLATSNNNSAYGADCLQQTTTGTDNCGFGVSTLLNNVGASRQTAMGNGALQTSNANDNTAYGYKALNATTSAGSTAVGAYALYKGTGGNNTGVGNLVLGSNVAGYNNVAVGVQALYTQVSSTNNVALGPYAGYYETGSSKLFIDNAARASEADGREKALIYGVFAAATADQKLTFNAYLGINTITPSWPLSVHLAGGNDQAAFGDTGATGKRLRLGYDFGNDGGVLYAIHEGTAYKNLFLNPSGGNVGIGTTSPGAKLDVTGNIYIRTTYGLATDKIYPYTGTGILITTVLDNSYIRFTGATERMRLNTTTGFLGLGTDSPDRLFHAEVSDAGTNAVVYAQRLSHITSGTAAAGFGTGTEYELENASGTNVVAATIEVPWTDATNASEDARVDFKVITAGSLTTALSLIGAYADATGLRAGTGGYEGATHTLPSQTPDGKFYFGFATNDAVNYPDTYGSILGYTNSANSYGYTYQIYHGASGNSGLYFRDATSSAWNAWNEIHLSLGTTWTGAVDGSNEHSQINYTSSNAAGADVGPVINLAGATGNATTPYGFAVIKAAKESAAAGSYAGYLQFYTVAADSSVTAALRLTSTGNIGGGIVPTYKLDLLSSVGNGNQQYIKLKDETADITGGYWQGANAHLVFGVQRTGFSEGASGLVDVITNHPLIFKTNDTERMRLLGAGTLRVLDKISFTQTDDNEYIDSLADGYLDIAATTGVRLGNGGTTNYSMFEADGTLVCNGTATVFNDANVGGLVLRTGGTAPGVVEILDNDGDATGIYTVGFAVNEQGSGVIEMPHDYKEGSDIVFHLHWGANDAPAGGTDNVKWQLIYSIARGSNTFPDAITPAAVEVAYTTQYNWLMTNLATITGSTGGVDGGNIKIGDQFHFTVKRIAASADEFGGEALVATMGLHYECDTLGSRTISAK